MKYQVHKKYVLNSVKKLLKMAEIVSDFTWLINGLNQELVSHRKKSGENRGSSSFSRDLHLTLTAVTARHREHEYFYRSTNNAVSADEDLGNAR